MRIVEQLAVFIANKPGTLVEVCEALAGDRVNIYGLTISDTVDHAVVRMVVSDTRKALASHKINIEYAYLASMPTAKRGLLILRVQDPRKVLKLLS